MKMQEVIAFHQAYKENLDAWLAGNEDEVEEHWRIPFSRAEDQNGGEAKTSTTSTASRPPRAGALPASAQRQRGRCVVPMPAVMNRAVARPSTSAVCQTPGSLIAA
jgi:hypothetical protein